MGSVTHEMAGYQKELNGIQTPNVGVDAYSDLDLVRAVHEPKQII